MTLAALRAAREQALTYFIGAGWTPAQAAGLVANLVAESALNPAAVGDGGRAYGIAQWHPDRQANFAAVIGRDIRGSTFEDQLAFVHAELTSTEKRAGDLLRASTTPSEAGSIVSQHYERPADRYGEAQKRAMLAEAIYREFITTVETQPAAPIEDRSRPYNAEQDAPPQEAPVFPLLIPLASALIQAFAPLAREKIAAEMNRHTTDKTIGDQIATSVIEAAKSFTGKADAIEAVAAAKSDPAIVAKVQEATIAKLDEIAPFLDKIASFETGAWAASEDSMDRAAMRAANTGPDFGAILVWWAVGAGTVILLGLFGIAVIYALKGMSLPEMVLTLIVQTVTGILGFVALIFAYRFGTSRSSGAKDELVAQLASRRQKQ